MITANGSLANCTGTKLCKIKHGDFECWMDVLFTDDIHEEVILGMDFLRSSESTKKELYTLKKAIDLGSSIVHELDKQKEEKSLAEKVNVHVRQMKVNSSELLENFIRVGDEGRPRRTSF
jgi:hypothetical protein